MAQLDGFQTTDSFRFDRHRSSSTFSLSSSSGYGSRLSLSQSSSHRRLGLSTYFKEKLFKHKSLASLLLSSPSSLPSPSTEQIYERVWNLDEQIENLRLQLIEEDQQSVISMSVDAPAEQQLYHRLDNDEEELLAAAAWYQEGLPRHICEEHLSQNDKTIGSFILRRSYTYSRCPFVLSLRTELSLVEHFLIERTDDHRPVYRLQGSSKSFDNLSTLVLHHTVIADILPVTLQLPSCHSIRSVRF